MVTLESLVTVAHLRGYSFDVVSKALDIIRDDTDSTYWHERGEAALLLAADAIVNPRAYTHAERVHATTRKF